jgi:hypothetical protein
MLVETIVYVQQACATGQCPAPIKATPQAVVTQPVTVEVKTKVKVRNRVRLFGGCKLFKGCR